MQASDEFWEQSFEEVIAAVPDLFFDDPFQPPGVSPSPVQSIGPGPNAPRQGRVGKPAARKVRPRSSKKAPTTLLAVDASNFRALVQQFTGFHSGGPLLRAYKGPINLNFKQRSFYPVSRPQRNLAESGKRFFPLGGKIDGSADRDRVEFDEDFGGLIVSSQSDGSDPALTCDGGFDVYEDSFWGRREMAAGGGECDAVLSGAVDLELWGY
ncbi:hypothetical protein AAHA92_30052 [Salvia divinorum]|uniref:VQ domain-containing protein n=1 Tax=Salvia divinorum TaxID=28513 RepID=A0ABD1G0C8_SALDI